MPHARRETLGRTFDVPANSATTETVQIAPDADPFHLRRIQASTETGNIGPTTVQVLVGAEAVAPTNEPISPAIDRSELDCEATVGPGGAITIEAETTSNSAVGVTVLLRGLRGDLPDGEE